MQLVTPQGQFRKCRRSGFFGVIALVVFEEMEAWFRNRLQLLVLLGFRICQGVFPLSGRMPASQAGRRGFESRLPLHLFNNLETSEIHALLRLLRFLSGDRLDDGVPGRSPHP